MVECGLIKLYASKSSTNKKPVEMEIHKDVSLSFEHIGIWLVIWAVFLGFALVIFIIEMFVKSFHELAVKKLKKVCSVEFQGNFNLIPPIFQRFLSIKLTKNQ
jgi:hypothetical protein